MDRRSPSPDRNHNNQIDNVSPDVLPKLITLEQHMMVLGLNQHKSSDQQVGLNETTSSRSDEHSARQTEDCSSECREGSALSNARDKEKDQLSPEEEEWLKSRPLDEYGKLREKIVNLANFPTPGHPILVGAGNEASTSHSPNFEHEYDQGKNYLEQGKYEKAAKLGESVIARLVKKYGLNHSQMLEAVNVLHGVTTDYLKRGWYKEAVEWNKHVIAICERRLGPDNPEMAVALIGQINAHIGLDEIEQAAKLGENVMDRLVKKYGQNHPQTLEAVNALHDVTADYLDNKKNYAKAAEWTKHAVDIFKRGLGPNHCETARALIGQGIAHIGLDNFKQAGRLCQEAFLIYEQNFGLKDDRTQTAERYSYLGQELGSYCLVKSLGRGGFAYVYLGEYQMPSTPDGEHSDLPTQAAVKVLHEFWRDSDHIKQFFYEAETLKKLNHPNIVNILEYDMRRDIPFMVMEYAPKGTLLDAYPVGKRVPLSQIVAIVNQIASALDYLHQEQILMHLDLKPENILVLADGRVLLSDFGLVRTIENTSKQQSLKTEELVGTAAYMAPEHIVGRKPRPRSDVFALAVMVYLWVSGEYPFKGDGEMIAGQHMRELSPPPLHSRFKDIPPKVEEVILEGLANNPKERTDAAGTFAKKLEDAWRKNEEQTLQGKINILEHEKCESQKEKQNLIDKIDNLDLKVQKLQQEKEELKGNVRDRDLKLQSMELEITTLQDQVRSLEAVLHEKETLEREKQILQRHNQELQNKVKNLEQKNSRSGKQESSKSIESLNRENEICKDLIGELIDSETRKKLIQRYYDSGMEHLRAGQRQKARDDFSRVIALDGNHAESFSHRGVAYLEMGQPELAEADFTQVLERDKDNTFALARRGAARLEMGQSELAEADFTQVLNRNDKDTFALAYRGVARREMKQFEKALADLTQARELGYSREWVIKAVKELDQRRG